jgi:hypothetical protein
MGIQPLESTVVVSNQIGQLSGQKLEQNQSQRIDIGALINRLRGFTLLRGHVAQRSQLSVGAGELTLVGG